MALLAGVLVLILGVGSPGQNVQDGKKVAKMTEKMKTVCVGRFLIDVPAEAQVTLSSAFVDGFNIATLAPESDADFSVRLVELEDSFAGKTNQRGKKSLESIIPIDDDAVHGRIFVYGREWTEIPKGGRKVMVEDVSVRALARIGGRGFDASAEGMPPRSGKRLAHVIGQIRPLGQDEIPPERGFCIDRAIVRDPIEDSGNESVSMFAGLPGHPDIHIVFSSMAGTRRGAGMLSRNATAAAKEPFYVRAAFTTLREGERTINGLPGEELVMKVREANLTTGYSFDWEMGGRQDDVLAPLLTLELESGTNPRAGGKPVQSSLSEEALLNLWDKISSSIRLRPTSDARAAENTQPLTPPLGTYLSAGEICPQSGWWQCNDGGDGIGVLGGQRQYLRKGQKMPQALLLPPQTLWQRVRGLQPSFESRNPTGWKLVDKRIHHRTPPVQGLAPSTIVEIDHVAGGGTFGTMSATAEAPIGSVVKTGMQCPASGWWRCEDAHALDGTRWFARGSLLPVATFSVAAGKFGRSSSHPQVIQRRSQWQLVRHEAAPAAPSDAAQTLPGDGGDNDSGLKA